MTSTNTALYVDENVSFKVLREQQVPAPSPGELLIETHFSGVNPADIKHSTQLGIYPSILGPLLGSSSSFHPGDIVAGYTPTGIGRESKYGTHQQYLICPEDMAFAVPTGLPQHHAACLSVVTMTAADALFNLLKLSLPREDPSDVDARPLLIWGASSSVGISAVQLARASGVYPIFVTASPERHPLLRGLGATHCFDYKSPNVISEIKTALHNGAWDLHHAFDTVGSNKGGTSSAKLMAECVSSPAATLISVVVQDDRRFQMPFATPNQVVDIHPTGAPGPITIPARPTDYQSAREAFLWAVKWYGGSLSVFGCREVFAGTAEEALEEVKALADHGRGFGKVVLQHPLK